MDFSTSIPGNALTKLNSLQLSDNALFDVITYMTLKGIKLPKIVLLSMGHVNIQTPIQTPHLQSHPNYNYVYSLLSQPIANTRWFN